MVAMAVHTWLHYIYRPMCVVSDSFSIVNASASKLILSSIFSLIFMPIQNLQQV